jgi:lipopolysaccharide transport system ATP-binding protein
MVSVRALRKEFACYGNSRDRLVEWLTLGRSNRRQTVVALDNITFQLPAGGSLGLVGANGAGKSTLLKILAGTLFATAGEVAVRGRVASLLELGLGFQPEFSGRRNIVFNARFLGLTDRQVRERMDEIIAFAELEDAIDRPLRTYSSGMQLRLAFAVVASTDPEVLIIDEALAVGDAHFTQKCLARIRRFRSEGTTLLFASHDPAALRSLCDQALLLDRGRGLEMGSPAGVLEHYNSLIARQQESRAILVRETRHPASNLPAPRQSAPREPALGPCAATTDEGSPVGRAAAGETSAGDRSRPVDPDPGFQKEMSGPHRSGNYRAVVTSLTLCDMTGQESRSFIAGDEAVIRIHALFLQEVEEPTVGVLIRDRLGNDVFGTNTFQQEIDTGQFGMGEVLEVAFQVPLNIGPGDYSLTVALHTLETHVHDSFDWIDRALIFKILPPPSGPFVGTTYLRPQIEAARKEPIRRVEDWTESLTRALGKQVPRRLTMAQEQEPWLLDGWYPPERGADGSFAWTGDSFAFLMDLRGEQLILEAGAGPADTGEPPARAEVWIFSQHVGSFSLESGSTWSKLRIPIPADLGQGIGLVRMRVQGWRPCDRGLGNDRRRLGLRVRSIQIA